MKQRLLQWILILSMVLALLPTTALATGAFSDMPDDYSTSALEAAVENELLNGADEKIMPDESLTRAQMGAILVRAFGATEAASISSYVDALSSAWYYEELGIAVQMGLLQGDGQTLRPDDAITRQEAFVVLARAFGLTSKDGTIADTYTDRADVADWAVEGVAAMIESGYVQGDGTSLMPMSNITRKDFAVVMDRMVKIYLREPGVIEELGEGNVMVSVPDVTLSGVTVEGTLILGDGVGDDGTTLNGVTVTERTLVRSGASSFQGENNLGQLVIASPDSVSLALDNAVASSILVLSNDVTLSGVADGTPVTTISATGFTLNGEKIDADTKVVVGATEDTGGSTGGGGGGGSSTPTPNPPPAVGGSDVDYTITTGMNIANTTFRTLTIAASVGDGDVTLTNCTVEILVVEGGGGNSCYIEGGFYDRIEFPARNHHETRLVLSEDVIVKQVDNQAENVSLELAAGGRAIVGEVTSVAPMTLRNLDVPKVSTTADLTLFGGSVRTLEISGNAVPHIAIAGTDVSLVNANTSLTLKTDTPLPIVNCNGNSGINMTIEGPVLRIEGAGGGDIQLTDVGSPVVTAKVGSLAVFGETVPIVQSQIETVNLQANSGGTTGLTIASPGAVTTVNTQGSGSVGKISLESGNTTLNANAPIKQVSIAGSATPMIDGTATIEQLISTSTGSVEVKNQNVGVIFGDKTKITLPDGQKVTAITPTLDRIEVTTLPTRMVYTDDKTADPFKENGAVVTAYYTAVANGFTGELSKIVTATFAEANGTVTASYTEGGVTKTDTFTITRVTKEIEEIFVSAPPKVTYKEGEDLDLTDAKITVIYTDSALYPNEEIAITANMVAGFNPDTPSKQPLTITHGGKTLNLTVTVQAMNFEGDNKLYATLQEALDAVANGGTVIIRRDHTIENGSEIIDLSVHGVYFVVEEGVTLTIANGAGVQLRNGCKLQVYGTLQNNGTIENNDTISLVANGEFYNTGTVQGDLTTDGYQSSIILAGSIVDGTMSTMSNSGTIKDKVQQFTYSFDTPTTAKLENTGVISQASEITLVWNETKLKQALSEKQTAIWAISDGTLTLTENLTIPADTYVHFTKWTEDGMFYDTKVEIPANSTLTLADGAKVDFSCDATNNGTIQSNGHLKVYGAGILLTSNGAINNLGILDILDGGVVENAGTFTNDNLGIIHVKPNGTFTNDGTLTNNGTVRVSGIGVVENVDDVTYQVNSNLQELETAMKNDSVDIVELYADISINGSFRITKDLIIEEEGSLTFNSDVVQNKLTVEQGVAVHVYGELKFTNNRQLDAVINNGTIYDYYQKIDVIEGVIKEPLFLVANLADVVGEVEDMLGAYLDPATTDDLSTQFKDWGELAANGDTDAIEGYKRLWAMGVELSSSANPIDVYSIANYGQLKEILKAIATSNGKDATLVDTLGLPDDDAPIDIVTLKIANNKPTSDLQDDLIAFVDAMGLNKADVATQAELADAVQNPLVTEITITASFTLDENEPGVENRVFDIYAAGTQVRKIFLAENAKLTVPSGMTLNTWQRVEMYMGLLTATVIVEEGGTYACYYGVIASEDERNALFIDKDGGGKFYPIINRVDTLMSQFNADLLGGLDPDVDPTVDNTTYGLLLEFVEKIGAEKRVDLSSVGLDGLQNSDLVEERHVNAIISQIEVLINTVT